MSVKSFKSSGLQCLRLGFVAIALFQFTIGNSLAAPANSKKSSDQETRTPIKHVIVIIGENRSFDHVFATYKPRNGQTVWNLLSEGIVNADGTPGPNFVTTEQQSAADLGPTDPFLLSPPKTPYKTLPPPLVGGPNKAVSYIPNPCATGTPETQCLASITDAKESENGLPPGYIPFLLTGGTLLAPKTPDTRIANVSALPPGPFQLTGKSLSYDDYAASPVHRFYQMWQQLDCSVSHATFLNPAGCDAQLFPWVEVTVGAGANGAAQPTTFNNASTGEGSTAMAFYNVQQGDVPYFKKLADEFAMSDNFHQSVQGGTGANHIMLGHGDLIWFSDGKGNAMPPPHKVQVAAGTPNGGIVDEVENPNPAAGTNNWYSEDGYGGGSFGSSSFGGGSYSACADATQPGVAPIVNYLKSLPRPVDPRCQAGHYYLLNNYNPGYFGQGENAYVDTNAANTVFTIPPSSVPSIADELLDAKISWKYYGDQWNNYAGNVQLGIAEDKYQINYGPVGSPNQAGTGPITKADEYCNICNPFQYDTSIMTNAAVRNAHIQDTANLYADIKDGKLPAVSFVKPSGLVDGHPASSKLDLFEGFTKKIVDAVEANPDLWRDTAIFVTFDEGGGYYDSGYVQPLDFFGDGTRIPLIVVSPYTAPGHIAHDYSDHVSILKFIERNWDLDPVTSRSRDNFPNPKAESHNPYVPVNGPAISDLFELFDFGRGQGNR